LSIHSGGFTLSADPIIETVPIEPARMEGRTIVQWDKEDLATLGLLKVDILALGMLTALRKTMDLVNGQGGEHCRTKPGFQSLTLATIPAEDVRTYRMIQRADTVGVFQIESRAQMSMLRRLLPRTFYDLVVQVAIVRPGPIVGEMVHPYLRRRRGLEPSLSPDPRLEPILGRTLGVPLFQEQVMKMAITMAGFTPGEADELRRAIGAWRSSGTIEKMGIKLRDGLLRSGLPEEFVQRVFQQIQGFAEYGFPESHAASFALLAYASSYLKCHYPVQFTCALINSQPMGFYSVSTLIEDAKHHGVKVLPLNPNHSDWDCTIENGALRVGWRVVQGVGETAALRIVEERGVRSFASLPDFLARTALPTAVLHRLAIGDAFESFGLDRRQALWEILGFWARKREQSAPQLDLFHLPQVLTAAQAQAPASRFKELSPWQAIQADHAVYGLSVQGHPMGALRRELGHKIPALKTMTSQKLRREPAGKPVRVVGMVIIRQRPPTAKGTAFATLEDEGGFIDLILKKEIMDKYKPVFLENVFLVVSGRVQRDGEMVNVIVNELRGLSEVGELG
jgi:error-prone DNA polymerase